MGTSLGTVCVCLVLCSNRKRAKPREFRGRAPLVWIIVTGDKEEVDVQTSRRGFLQLLAGGVVTAALTGCAPGSSALTVTFLEVGKADAIVLSTAG